MYEKQVEQVEKGGEASVLCLLYLLYLFYPDFACGVRESAPAEFMLRLSFFCSIII